MLKRLLATSEDSCKKPKQVPWIKHLREHGYAVIPQLLGEDKIVAYQAEFWTWIEGFGTGIRRDDPTSWTKDKWPISNRGLLQHYGIGHAKFIWDLRTEPAVLDAFSTLWATNKLLVSFDGACLATPYKKPPPAETQSWAHMDQGPKRKGRFECAQGLVTLSDAGPGLGGLVVYADSHRLHEQFYAEHAAFARSLKSSDWCKLSEQHRQWFFDRGAKQVHIEAPAGSLLLWDSRTVHWAAKPMPTAPPRMAVYLCYVPRSHITPRELERKKKAFEDRRTTNHWPAQPRMFSKTPWIRDETSPRLADRPTITDSEVTAKISELAGY